MTVFGGVRIVVGIAVMAFAGIAGAQENLDSKKSPAQLFASDCAICHKTPQGLNKSGALFGMEGFLREHYTASRESAAAIAAYIRAAGNAPSGPAKKATKGGAKSEAKSDAKGETKSETKGDTKRRAKGGEKGNAGEKMPEAGTDVKLPGDNRPADSKAAEPKPAESKPVEAKPVEAKPAEPKSEPAETKPAQSPKED